MISILYQLIYFNQKMLES